MKLKINTCKTIKDENYETQIIDTAIDICRAFQGVRSNFIARLLFEPMMKGKKASCPLKNGNTTLNMKLSSDFLPPFNSLWHPEGKLKFYLMSDAMGAFNGKKKMNLLFTFKAFGIFYNSDIFKSMNDVKF